jgi:hypothetical protein
MRTTSRSKIIRFAKYPNGAAARVFVYQPYKFLLNAEAESNNFYNQISKQELNTKSANRRFFVRSE